MLEKNPSAAAGSCRSLELRRPKAVRPRKPNRWRSPSVPMIGNYQLPPMDFLQHADMTLKPTESKEELMFNARLMQQTLAQFDIRGATRRHHQRPDHHALRTASARPREAWKKSPR